MNNSIYPCIWFNNNGREAADFYCKIFPHARLAEDSGIVQMLELNGQKMMLLNGGPQFQPNASVSFLVPSMDESVTEDLFYKLAEDGIVLMPLDSYPFSKKYGWVRDRYGVTWQLYTGEKGNTDQYFTPTMMFVGKNNGKAKEALSFYTSIFSSSAIDGIMEYPEGGEDTVGNVQHAQFSIDGFMMACMDSSYSHDFNFDEGISIVVNTKDQEETDYYWNALVAAGGSESMCGWLKDKYGVSWQIVPKQLLQLVGSPDKERSQRAFQAMLKMKKIIIADLEKAANEG